MGRNFIEYTFDEDNEALEMVGVLGTDGKVYALKVDPTTGRLKVETTVTGVAEVNLDETTDEVGVYGGVDGSETADAATRQIVNVKADGAVRTDLKYVGDTAVSVDGGRQQVNATVQVADADASNTNPVPVSDAAGSLTVDNPTLSVVGGGTETGALRVTLANNSTGLVSVDDNGVSLTVDAVDLDIRNLDDATDAVRIGDGVDLANVTAAGELNVLATAQPGVDVGDVTVNNPSGASAVNVQDGGNSLTVDQATASNLNAQVQGPAADGVALVGNPVVIAGVSSGLVQALRTNSSGDPFIASAINHDDADSGGPLKVGGRAIAHGANPTAVAVNDRSDFYTNRHGILWTIAGHPNTQTREYHTTIARTDDPIIPVVGAGTKIVVTGLTVTVDEAATVGVDIRIGFGAAGIAARVDGDSVSGVVFSHAGAWPGGGAVRGDGGSILGQGADGEDLFITCGVPTGGSVNVIVTYFTIES